MSESKSQQVYLVIAIAGITYFFLDTANSFIATPLRELSSHLAHFFLNMFAYPVTKTGTILETPNMRFDVIPACNGSTTLKVMMSLGIYWSWTHPKLTTARRLLCSFLTIPIALLANGLRVAALVAVSHNLEEVVGEGPLHTAIGLMGFAIAMIALFITSELLSTEVKKKSNPLKVQAILLGTVLLIAYIPFFGSCLNTWKGSAHDPFDAFGYIFVLIGMFPLIKLWKQSPYQSKHELLGVGVYLVSLIFIIAGALVDIKYLLGVSLIVSIFALGLAYKGIAFALASAPLLGIIYLGFPKITIQINFVLSKILQLSAWNHSMLLRIPILVICFLVYLKLKQKCVPKENDEPLKVKFLPLFLCLAVLIALGQIYIYSSPASSYQPSKLKMSFLQDKWVGSELSLSQTSIDYFGRKNIWSRLYKSDKNSFHVLINSSGGSRHRNHPPEYCMTGVGWKIADSQKVQVNTKSLGEIPVTKITLEKDGITKNFMYWFSDGSETHADYMKLMAADTLRRLQGQRTDWFLFRVIAEDQNGDIETFLKFLEFEIIPPEAS